jgi:hypothetical protein
MDELIHEKEEEIQRLQSEAAAALTAKDEIITAKKVEMTKISSQNKQFGEKRKAAEDANVHLKAEIEQLKRTEHEFKRFCPLIEQFGSFSASIMKIAETSKKEFPSVWPSNEGYDVVLQPAAP